ncbi:tRNA (N6-threonylcarbamoyladenosine(37)-N6)-methyltransferase TrmO [Thalassotalea euphylliae]|uniref:tRNA (N6-threonylcarbamoyladenosine(37)-N6)-methyltransferase TrmO n=1 Tax=Thalassotalea euphylliae TaxID=1655234 RepID=A0A3E0TPR8_9GAMM|nr:tRNA (N6-threonylcarbamoyladenosine(37)-N6)-methyltransferase TrmO [Thalassotalea euphylliae]REL26539.1 tRNA (N6-threonylcarbamoyladenosine(37)-N6)-methyltransferase TrmO [Thalassotalea euphylliae]
MSTSTNNYSVSAIGTVSSPYKEKFAIPRQPGLVTAAKGYIELTSNLDSEAMVAGLEGYSHIWVLFMFHQNLAHGWKAKVKPPRLGGNKKIGVLATRSTFRPNGIGMSVLPIDKVETIRLSHHQAQTRIYVSGLDLLDGTPVIDIKPYIPYSDSLTDASAGFAEKAPQAKLAVSFSESAQQVLASTTPALKTLIEQVLAQDPRPAYRQNKPDEHIYGMHLHDFNITWQCHSLHKVQVLAISPYESNDTQ